LKKLSKYTIIEKYFDIKMNFLNFHIHYLAKKDKK